MKSRFTVRKLAEADFPTRWGHFRILGFEGNFPEERRADAAVALVMGDLHATPPLVRIQSQCLTGDVFSSLRCDCREQLEMAIALIGQSRRWRPGLRATRGPGHRPHGQTPGL